jgi:hypothetical protein
MAFDQKGLDNYIDVAQRIADFREQYPGGSLQPADPAHPWEQAVVTGYGKDGQQFTATMIVYTAAAYRDGLDRRPGIGVAWEVFPGRTPYTLGSELMNAETSAWGRAIIAVGASDSKRGITSREEVRNRQAEQDPAQTFIEQAREMRRRPPEVDEHGAATQAEITRMQTGPEGTVRLTAADPADEWAGQAAGKVTLHRELENEPGSSDGKQRQAIAMKLEKLGFATPEAGRAECSRIIGREIATRKDLSFTEAAAILAALDKEAASA